MAANQYIRKSNSELEITPEQVLEVKRCMADPIYFCRNYVKIVHPKLGVVPLDLYDYQEDMINLYKGNDRVVVMSARQTGKSVVAGAYIAWFNMFNFKKTTLIVSNHNANSMEMVSRIRDIYENLPMWLKPGANTENFNKHELEFDNGCRIVSKATTKDSGRGLDVSLLYSDELAFIEPRIQQEFWASITPTLSTGGSAIITSTPNGDQGLFADLWRGAEMGTNEYKSLYVPWDAPPGRDDDFKRKMISDVGERKWKQEFECEFISSDALLISSMFMGVVSSEIKKHEIIREVQGVKFWENIKSDKTYLLGVDPATGSGKDYSVIQVFSFPTMEQVAEYRNNTMNTNDLYDVLKNLLQYLVSKNCLVYFSVENNGVGEGIISLFENDETQPEVEFITDANTTNSKRRGMTTTTRNKMAACVTFKQMFESGTLKIKSSILLKELKSFVRSKSAYAAQDGATDDCVAAVLIIVRILQDIAYHEDAAFDTLYGNHQDEESHDEWSSDWGDDDSDVGVIVI